METQGTFKIAEPCHENWNKMTPEAQGRFCASCQRCVVDFSGKTQTEVKQIYDQEGGDVCGRMKISQLRPPRPSVRAKFNLYRRPLKSLQMFGLALFAAFTFLFQNPVHGQKEVMGKMAYVAPEAQVGGHVTWDSGEPAAEIKVEVWSNGTVVASTVTDEKGNYFIDDLREGEFIVTAYGGFGARASETVRLTGRKTVKQDLVLHDRMIMGELMYIPEPEETPEIITPVDETPLPEGTEAEAPVNEETAWKADALLDPNESIAVSDFEVKVFPNPSADEVTLLVQKAGDHNLTVTVVDVDGKVVYTGKWVSFLESRKTIDLTAFPAGVYILQLSAGDDHVERRLLKI